MNHAVFLRFKFSKIDYPESYFHYILGYAYPVVSQVIKDRKTGLSFIYYLEAYGDIMDEKLEELLTLLEVNYKILRQTRNETAELNTIYVNRWDKYLGIRHYFQKSPLVIKIKLLTKLLLRDRQSLRGLLNPSTYFNDIKQLKEIILGSGSFESDEINLSIIKRVNQSDVYDKQLSIGHGYQYGSLRRQMKNVEILEGSLSELGLKYSYYTPGEDSILNQVKHFNSCKTLIVQRGAELANCIWMKKGSKVILIDNFGGQTGSTNPIVALGNYLGIDFRVIKTNEETYTNRRDLIFTKDLVQTITHELGRNDS